MFKNFKIIFIISVVFLFSSCTKQEVVYKYTSYSKKTEEIKRSRKEKQPKKIIKKYKAPVKVVTKKIKKSSMKLNSAETKLFNKQIMIKTINKSKLKDYEKLIKTAYSFLYKNFGKPKYTKKVEVIIHGKSIKHPTSTWTKNKNQIRKVNFSDFYMHKSDLPTIVHELFHALYQTNDFIFSNTEFILEGTATYVEKMYKYKNDEKKIKEMFLKDIKMNHICKLFSSKYNFNNPFKLQNKRKIYYLYILSGSFFAIQDNIKGKDLIIKLLNDKSKKVETNKSIEKKITSIFSKVFKIDNKSDKNNIEKIIEKYKLNSIKHKINIDYFCKD